MKKMTEKSLNEAFAGESMAHMKYLAFANIAEKEGLPKIANLFRAIAYAEQVHAINHAKTMGILQKTLENIQSGLDGENFEIDEMYPAYQAIAELQDEKGAARSLRWAVEAEKDHADLYTIAKEAVEQGKDFEYPDIYVCEVCGHTIIGEPKEACPICGVSKEKYKKFSI